MSPLEAVLCATAVIAGFTGTWSPCGFSMIDTIAAGSRDGRSRLTAASCLAFAVGTVAGGGALFAGLAALGAMLATAGLGAPSLAAAAIAAGVAVAELTGARVRPQVRRQVPEHWRRSAPLPVASLAYGVLLGLGFTTFVLSLAVPALAALALMLGEPVVGALIGVSFGIGRALPVVAIAPIADSAVGLTAVEVMAERPAALRGLRAAGGLALALCALGLASEPASAATPVARPATDPSAADGALAWQEPGGPGMLRRGAALAALGGRAPALGGGMLASIEAGDVAVVRRLPGLEPVFARALPGADKLAVTSRWLVARQRLAGGTRIVALGLGDPSARPRTVAAGGSPGRPAAQGNRVVWHSASLGGSRIFEADLRTGRRRTRLRARNALLLNPSIDGPRMLYVRVSACGQFIMLRRGRHARLLARRRAPSGADTGFERGHTSQGSGTGPCPRRRAAGLLAWTTALDGHSAYVAFIRPAAAAATRAAVVRFRAGG